MTIWLLAILLLASLAGLGYRQGVIRVAFSLLGILFGALLAPPLGKLVAPLFKVFGVKNPALLWVLGPLAVFFIISIIFKIAALGVHTKIDVHYKYNAGELRMALWERLHRRLGLCLGLLNGAIYIILISWVIYAFSYWTVQMATSDTDPKMVKILNSMGQDLHNTGFAKVAGAVDRLKPTFYETADVAGLLYNNSLLEARLSRYPGFLGLAERPEFQDLGNDRDFSEMRLRRDPIMTVMNYPKVQGILYNPELVGVIWATVVPDLKDLTVFLETAKSAKYDPEKILGRWNFNVNATLALHRRAKPNISSTDMLKLKKWMVVAFSKATVVATTEHQAILKNVPPLKAAAAATGSQTLQGQWQGGDGKYQLTFTAGSGNDDLFANVEGDRLILKITGMDLVFDRES
jgi:uncharacterized membrane protein required for colicin V production